MSLTGSLSVDFISLVKKRKKGLRVSVKDPGAVVQMCSQDSTAQPELICTITFFNHSAINELGFLPLSLQSTNTWSECSRVKSAAVEQMRMSSLISSVRKETQVFKCKSFPKILFPALQACDLNNAQQQSGKCRIIWLSERHNKCCC